MSQYLNRAIELALENVYEGGTPYGAVLVIGDEILGEGVNTMHHHHDVSGHAEMIAIRQAQEKLKTNDLSNAVIYASGHPCPMCLGAIGIVGIKKVIYSNTVEEAAKAGMPIAGQIYDYLKGNKTSLELVIEHESVPKEMMDPMRLFREKKHK